MSSNCEDYSEKLKRDARSTDIFDKELKAPLWTSECIEVIFVKCQLCVKWFQTWKPFPFKNELNDWQRTCVNELPGFCLHWIRCFRIWNLLLLFWRIWLLGAAVTLMWSFYSFIVCWRLLLAILLLAIFYIVDGQLFTLYKIFNK